MNLRRWYTLCFLIAVLAFISFFVYLFFFSPNDTAAWTAFSILMPITGGAVGLGILLWAIAWIKK